MCQIMSVRGMAHTSAEPLECEHHSPAVSEPGAKNTRSKKHLHLSRETQSQEQIQLKSKFVFHSKDFVSHSADKIQFTFNITCLYLCDGISNNLIDIKFSFYYAFYI